MRVFGCRNGCYQIIHGSNVPYYVSNVIGPHWAKGGFAIVGQVVYPAASPSGWPTATAGKRTVVSTSRRFFVTSLGVSGTLRCMKNSISPSPTPAPSQNRTAAISLPKRTTAAGSRVLTPTPAAGEVLLVSLVIMLGSLLGFAANRAPAAYSPPAGHHGQQVNKHPRSELRGIEPNHIGANLPPSFSSPT